MYTCGQDDSFLKHRKDHSNRPPVLCAKFCLIFYSIFFSNTSHALLNWFHHPLMDHKLQIKKHWPRPSRAEVWKLTKSRLCLVSPLGLLSFKNFRPSVKPPFRCTISQLSDSQLLYSPSHLPGPWMHFCLGLLSLSVLKEELYTFIHPMNIEYMSLTCQPHFRHWEYSKRTKPTAFTELRF